MVIIMIIMMMMVMIPVFFSDTHSFLFIFYSIFLDKVRHFKTIVTFNDAVLSKNQIQPC